MSWYILRGLSLQVSGRRSNADLLSGVSVLRERRGSLQQSESRKESSSSLPDDS